MTQKSLKIDLISAFNDNYIFVIEDVTTGTLAVVDPGDAEATIEWLENHQKTLNSILVTHHHNDHIGGVNTLREKYGAHVFGAKSDLHRIPFIDTALSEGDTINIGNHRFKIYETPGHTTGHIIYFTEETHVISQEGEDNAPLLFCGDTLFAMGCGRLFEGTAQDMYESFEKIKSLKSHTKIYCTHEYTLSNADFALSINPDNQDLINRIKDEKEKRAMGKPTVPTTLEKELKTNPFMRVENADEFGRIRALKDNF